MKKILVVNNDFDTMSLLKNWLEKKAYSVKYTSSKEEVPGILDEFKPELILIDVLKKEIVEKLKENKVTRQVPLILMTGYSLRQQSTELSVDDTIEKPFNLPLLEKKIERLIRNSG